MQRIIELVNYNNIRAAVFTSHTQIQCNKNLLKPTYELKLPANPIEPKYEMNILKLIETIIYY